MSEKQQKSLLPVCEAPQKPRSSRTSAKNWVIGALFAVAFFKQQIGGAVIAGLGLEDLRHKDPVNWKPCEGHPGFVCGYLDVPKDYDDPSAGVATIAMSKLSATVPKKDRKGSIFLNPGGPGGSGYDFSFRFSEQFSQILLGHYDLIGFDPRGIGRTTPRVECFPSGLDYTLFKAGSIMEMDFDVAPDPFSEEGRQRFITQHRELLAMQETQGIICDEAMGDELKYMGTTTVIRDIEEMSRVIEGEDVKINFFGGSYGTIVGAYLANMLPAHKLGKILIDGVANADDWANSPSYEWLSQGWLDSTEDTWRWFLKDCHESGPTRCALSLEGDKSPSDIDERLMKYLDDLYYAPVAAPGAQRPGMVTTGVARTQFYLSTNAPQQWQEKAKVFADAVYNNNPAALRDLHVKGPIDFKLNTTYPNPSGQSQLSRAAVDCADSPFLPKEIWPTAEDMTELTLKTLKEESPRFGASITIAEPDGGCQFWPSMQGYRAERFSGPWNNTLDYPMMIISNTADPITPLLSGRLINKSMGNSSRLLIQDSPGHCSLGSSSVCRIKATRAYFLYDELPENGVVCPIDASTYFPPEDFTLENQMSAMSVEDREMFVLGNKLAESWTQWCDETDI